MKILMLCIEFPPINTTGNYRSAGFARYLLKSNIEPIVLTAEEESAADAFNKKKDLSLLKGLENLKIHRFPIKKVSSLNKYKLVNYFRIWSSVYDSIGKRWYYGDNKKQIDAAILKEKPDVLYVSMPPFSMGIVALDIANKFSLPLITDMRDAWSLWGSAPYSTRIHYNLVKRLEYKLFKYSKYIISTSEEMASDFYDLHKDIDKNKFKVIYNGYDKFEEVSATVNNNTVYTVGYVGGFYYDPNIEDLMNVKWYKRSLLKKFYYSPRKEYWKYRSPFYFLKAIYELFESQPQLKSKIKFEYIGNAPDWLNDMIEEFNLQDNFINHGFLPKNEVLKIESTWDAILATSEKIENGHHYTIPSKSFDSIKLKKQILAFVTPGSQYIFLKNYKQSIFFNPDDIEANTKKLKQVITANKTITYDELSEVFTREHQSKKFLQLIKPCANES